MSNASTSGTDRLRALLRARPRISVESLVAIAALVFTALYNSAFWAFLATKMDLTETKGWVVMASFAVLVWGLHTLLFLLVLARWNAKPILAVITIISALATYYVSAYSVFLDADMIRNVLHSEPKEASELLTAGMLWSVLVYGVLPVLVMWRVSLVQRSWLPALGRRVLAILGVVALVVAVGLASFQDVSALMRNNKPMRYLVTPGNWITSLGRVAQEAMATSSKPHIPVGTDAVITPSRSGRPKLLVIVVGETVRAQNWGLSGYERNTTPQLASRPDVVNFNDVTACGTSTEVSLPCMFSALGRRNYDKDAIARSDSLLHVLDHAGVATSWRDNQTGCKGVCEGLPFESFLHADVPELCNGERCFDEVLLHGLADRVAAEPDTQVVVLHQLGNHGPSYFSRYPQAFESFVPACQTAQLGDCSTQEVINAYDNSILYTDHFLARTIDFLARQEDRDTAMIYLSDHGESLGEGGLFLHGIPYQIAPETQTKVPLLVWLSPGLQRNENLSLACLMRKRATPLSHDNLFSSVLGLLGVRTSVYDPGMDIFRGCQRPAA